MHLWNCWLQGLLSLEKRVFKNIEHLGHTPSKTSTHFLVKTYLSIRKKKLAKTWCTPKQTLQEKRPLDNRIIIFLSSSHVPQASGGGPELLGDETSDPWGALIQVMVLLLFHLFFCLEYS